MPKKIYLSPSNQNRNTYAAGNTVESVQCNRIARITKELLEHNSFTVKVAPEGQAMADSIAESNAWNADLHICIHTNAGGGQGTLAMVYNEAGIKYAQPIYDEMKAITLNHYGYGIKIQPQWAELRGTKATAVYLECEFHDREDLALWIIANVNALGEAIARGVCKLYNVAYQSDTNTPAPAPQPSPAVPLGTAHQIGEHVIFSTCYTSSTAPNNEAISAAKMQRNHGVITKIVPGAKNPYLLDNGMCWVNDGDIRGPYGEAAAPPPAISNIGVCTGDGVRLRAAPVNGNVLGLLYNGDRVTILSEVDGWYQVKREQTTGYVSGDYLRRA